MLYLNVSVFTEHTLFQNLLHLLRQSLKDEGGIILPSKKISAKVLFYNLHGLKLSLFVSYYHKLNSYF